MMRYEESGDFTTTLHRRLLYILNENLPGSTWYCIAMKMLQYYGDLDMISIEEMASLCAVSKSTISKFIREPGNRVQKVLYGASISWKADFIS